MLHLHLRRRVGHAVVTQVRLAGVGIQRRAASTSQDLIDPMKFFGSADNIQRVLTDIATFSDLESMNTAPMSEWILKSC